MLSSSERQMLPVVVFFDSAASMGGCGQSNGDLGPDSGVVLDEGDVGVQGGAARELADSLQQEWRHRRAGQAALACLGQRLLRCTLHALPSRCCRLRHRHAWRVMNMAIQFRQCSGAKLQLLGSGVFYTPMVPGKVPSRRSRLRDRHAWCVVNKISESEYGGTTVRFSRF